MTLLLQALGGVPDEVAPPISQGLLQPGLRVHGRTRLPLLAASWAGHHWETALTVHDSLLKAPPGFQAQEIRLVLALALESEEHHTTRRGLYAVARKLTQTKVCWPWCLFQVGSRMVLRGDSSLGP